MSARGGIVAGLALAWACLVQCSGDSGGGTHLCVGIPAPTTPPIAPSLLVLTVASSTQIDLAWSDNSADETGFRVERSSDGVAYAEVALVAAGSVAHSDGGLTPGSTYWYRVRATNAAGNSAYTNIATIATPMPPNAPTGLSATPISGTRIDLSWTDASPDETGFRLERSSDGVNFLEFLVTAADVTAHSDTGLTMGTAYWYRVRATNGVGDSGYSNVATATTFSPPAAPTNLVAIAVSPYQVSLSWTDNSSDETGFRVWSSDDGVIFSVITTTAPDVTTFPHASAGAESTYWYLITAINAAGQSPDSNIAVATTWPDAAWRTLGHNARHTGDNRAEAGGPPLTPLWSTPLWAFPSHPVAADANRVIATRDATGASPFNVRGLDAATGAISWSSSLDNADRVGQPALWNDRAHVVAMDTSLGDARVRTFDAMGGGSIWQFPFVAQTGTPWAPIVAGNRLYTHGGSDGILKGFTADTGTVLFQQPGLGSSDRSSPAFHNGDLYSLADGVLTQHNPISGVTGASVSLPWSGTTNAVSPVIGDSLIYILAPPNLHALDPVVLSVVWTTSGFDTNVNVAYAKGMVLVTSGGTVQARDALTGTWLWSFITGLQASYPPVVAGNFLYIGGPATGYAVDLSNPANFQVIPAGGWYSVAEGRLYAARPNGTLSCYALTPGTLPAPLVAPPAPTGLTVTPSSSARIALSWTDNASDEMSYRVERTTDGIAYSVITILGAGAAAWVDVGLDPATSYGYRVRATNAIGNSPWSTTVFGITAAAAPSWPMYSGGPDHLGVNAGETGHPPITPAWQAAISADPINPVVVEDGYVFVTEDSAPASGKFIRARRLSNGTSAWSAAVGVVPSLGPPAVSKGRVFVPMENGAGSKLLCLDARSGAALWAAPFDAAGQKYYAPTVAADTVWINAGSAGGCAGYRVGDGGRLFFNGSLENYDRWTPGYSAGTLFTYVDGKFRAHNPLNGAIQWTGAIAWPAGTSMDTVPAIGATHAFAAGQNSLNAINLATHAVDATQPVSAIVGSPVLAGGLVFAVSAGSLRAYDATTLAPLWGVGGDGALNHTPVVAGGTVYVSSNANTFAVDIATQALPWTDGIGGHLSIAAGKLLVARPDGTVSAYSLTP